MSEQPFCQIILTGLDSRERQGVVRFSDTEEALSFQTLIELIHLVEHKHLSTKPFSGITETQTPGCNGSGMPPTKSQ